MADSVKLSDLREMCEEGRRRALSSLVQAALDTPNGKDGDELDAQIREFERRYQTSSPMMEELATGKRRETAEVASWLMLIRLKEEFGLSRSL